jgi:hypothetical protein
MRSDFLLYRCNFSTATGVVSTKKKLSDAMLGALGPISLLQEKSSVDLRKYGKANRAIHRVIGLNKLIGSTDGWYLLCRQFRLR